MLEVGPTAIDELEEEALDDRVGPADDVCDASDEPVRVSIKNIGGGQRGIPEEVVANPDDEDPYVVLSVGGLIAALISESLSCLSIRHTFLSDKGDRHVAGFRLTAEASVHARCAIRGRV